MSQLQWPSTHRGSIEHLQSDSPNLAQEVTMSEHDEEHVEPEEDEPGEFDDLEGCDQDAPD